MSPSMPVEIPTPLPNVVPTPPSPTPVPVTDPVPPEFDPPAIIDPPPPGGMQPVRDPVQGGA